MKNKVSKNTFAYVFFVTLAASLAANLLIRHINFSMAQDESLSPANINQDGKPKSPAKVVEWKEYKNSNYGFTFKYPGNYSVKSLRATDTYPAKNYQISSSAFLGGVSVNKKDAASIQPKVEILVYKDAATKGAEGLLTNYPQLKMAYTLEEKMTLNARAFQKFSQGPAGTPTVMAITSGKYVYQINIDYGDKPQTGAVDARAILAMFTFEK